MKMRDITEMCKECTHKWLEDDGEENRYCQECNWSDKQKTMINFEKLLD